MTKNTSQLESNSVGWAPEGGSEPSLTERLDTARLLALDDEERRREIRRLDRELRAWERNRSAEQAAWASARLRPDYDGIMPGLRRIVSGD